LKQPVDKKSGKVPAITFHGSMCDELQELASGVAGTMPELSGGGGQLRLCNSKSVIE